MKAARVLRKALRLFDGGKSWGKRQWFYRVNQHTVKMCAIGAIGSAGICGIDDVIERAERVGVSPNVYVKNYVEGDRLRSGDEWDSIQDTKKYRGMQDARKAVEKALKELHGRTDIVSFNDDGATTWEDIERVFERAVEIAKEME